MRLAEKINRIVPDYMAMGEKGGSMGGRCRCRKTPCP
jgi:hypothetical protein